MTSAPEEVHRALDHALRADRGRLIAALSSAIGNFALAEDCLQGAIETALATWGKTGVPRSPNGWLLQVARRRAIDDARRGTRFNERRAEITMVLGDTDIPPEERLTQIPDERLRLMFTCCHPALDGDAQVALTLRAIGGLTTAEVARAFLVPTATMAARITRAKAKIVGANIPFAAADISDRDARLAAVLRVIYLIYNEGYATGSGAQQLRLDLCQEALFLARLVVQLAPDASEPCGLLALILFSHARRDARHGDFVALSDQDRGLWDDAMIAEADQILQAALRRGQAGPYQIQAAIHGLHAQSTGADDTDWPQIAGLYAVLYRMTPTDVVALNLAVAQSYGFCLTAGRTAVLALGDRMGGYQPYYAALADIEARLGHVDAAVAAYQRAIDLSGVDGEKRFLRHRMQTLIGS